MDVIYTQFSSDRNLNKLKDNGQALLEKYSRPEGFDKLAQAQTNVNGLKVDMQQNVNKLIEGQEHIDNLEDQTREMKDNAQTFDKQAKSLEREMFWRKVKYTVIIIVIIIVIVLILGLSIGLTR